jgi:uncharacterized membrane protein YccF (DUF307 family)
MGMLYTIFIGIPLALMLWAFAFVAAITIIGLPLAGVLATLAVKVLTISPRPRVVAR